MNIKCKKCRDLKSLCPKCFTKIQLEPENFIKCDKMYVNINDAISSGAFIEINDK